MVDEDYAKAVLSPDMQQKKKNLLDLTLMTKMNSRILENTYIVMDLQDLLRQWKKEDSSLMI